jgi:hypothetical protein
VLALCPPGHCPQSLSLTQLSSNFELSRLSKWCVPHIQHGPSQDTDFTY